MNPFAELSAAKSLLDAKNHDGAMRRVDAVLEDLPDFTLALGLAVAIEFSRSDYTATLERARTYLAEDPNDPDIRCYEAIALAKLKRRKDAEEALKRFQQDFPDKQRMVDTIATHIHLSAGKQKKALGKLHDLRSSSEGKGELKNIAIALHRIGDLFEAHNQLLEAAKQGPQDYDLAAALASNCLLLGKLSQARRYARMALAMEPGNPTPKRFILLTYFLYFPPFFFVLIACSSYLYLRNKLHWTLALAVTFLPMLPAFRSFEIFLHLIEIPLRIRIPGFVATLSIMVIWFLAWTASEKVLQSNLNRPVKPQTLKDY